MSPGAQFDVASAHGEEGASSWPVAVFAHNEARHIERCLDTLGAAAPGRELDIFVLENGSTDATSQIVKTYARNKPNVKLINIKKADWCNAFNYFIYDLGIEADVYFFVDGDIRVNPNAFSYLFQALEDNPAAHVGASFPATGRNMASTTKIMSQDRAVAGNLYALRGEFVERMREFDLRLPVGLIGDDGMIEALAKWDLDPGGKWLNERVAPVPEAEFSFESLSWLHLHDWKIYWNRRIRYSIRHFQFKMLGPLLRERGLASMPRKIETLYAMTDVKLSIRWSGLNPFFDWIARRRIRSSAAKQRLVRGT